MKRSRALAVMGLLLMLAACQGRSSPAGSTTDTVESAGIHQSTGQHDVGGVLLPPLPGQGLVIGRRGSVEFVTLEGDLIHRLPGFSLYYDWTVPGPVILRSDRVFYILDVGSHTLTPLGSRDEAFDLAPQFQEGVDPSNERFRLVDEPDKTGAADASGFWAYALPSPDGSRLLAEWSGECESQTAFLALADGSNPVPVTGGRGLAEAPSSSAIGWTANGGALVFLGTETACGSGSALSGVYRFNQPGVGTMVVPVPEPGGVRMWGTA